MTVLILSKGHGHFDFQQHHPDQSTAINIKARLSTSRKIMTQWRLTWWLAFLTMEHFSAKVTILFICTQCLLQLIDYSICKHNFYMHWKTKKFTWLYHNNLYTAVVWKQTHNISEACLESFEEVRTNTRITPFLSEICNKLILAHTANNNNNLQFLDLIVSYFTKIIILSWFLFHTTL